MDKTKLEKLARLSGKAASKALGALERRGYDIRRKLAAPINRVPGRGPPEPNRTSEHRHPGGEGFHGRPGNDLQLAAA